jgi:hypothetical protein
MDVKREIVSRAAVHRYVSMENVEEDALSVLARQSASIKRTGKIV